MSTYLMRSAMVCTAALLLAAMAGCSGPTTPPQPEVDRNTADPFAAATDAAFKGDLAYVKSCVESDPRYIESADGFGRTLLHYAAEGGHVEMVAYLLENGASVFAEDEDGRSPFDSATQGDAPKEVMDLLIQAANTPQ